MVTETAPRMPLLVVDGPAGGGGSLATPLRESGVASRVSRVGSLAEALGLLSRKHFGAVLMDITLLDTAGLAAVTAVRESAPATPVIVVSETEDPERAAASMAAGAQDYIVRGHAAPLLLRRVVLCAVERQRRERGLERLRHRRQREREIGYLEKMSGAAPSAVTSRLFGSAPLLQAFPNEFRAFVEEYRELLDAMMDERAFRVDHGVAERTRALARQIGVLRGGARDVVDVHTAALREHLRGTPRRAAGIMQEGRLLALQLMGYLVAFYRASYGSGAAAEGPHGTGSDGSV